MPLYSPSHRSSAKGQSPVYRETRRSVPSRASERSRHPRQTPKSGSTDQKKCQGHMIKKAKYGKVVKRRQSVLCRLSPSKSGPEVNQTETSLASREGDTDHDWIYDKKCKQIKDTLRIVIWDEFSKSPCQLHVQFVNEKDTYQASWNSPRKKRRPTK